MNTKTPPHNLEAEQSVIGGLMLDPNAWDQVVDILSEADFYKSAHRTIFSTIQDLQNKGQPVDILTVSSMLNDRDQLGAIGSAGYLAEIIDSTPSAVNIKTYAELIREKSLLRRVISTGSEIIEEAYGGDYGSVDEYVDRVEAKIFQILDKRKTAGLVPASEIVRASLEKIEELHQRKASITGIATGFDDLDKMTSGFQPGELIIIAARPSMGKTALGLTIVNNIALKSKKKVAFFSLEMAREQIMVRILASAAKIEMGDLRVGRVPDSSWSSLISAASEISESDLYIDDTSAISPFEIRAKCRRLAAQKGLDLIVIDYLQIMDLKQRVESRERAVSEISRTLKAISKELKVPVVALAQLNRGVEGRSDRRPMLSDLRESGSIEQDADVIMMIYRDEYYEKDQSETKGVAEIIINKQRNGPTGTVKLAWLAKYGTFANLAPDSLMSPPLSPAPPSYKPGAPRASGGIPNLAPGKS
ncbi:MAG: replicative DNA helicase [Bdellovibrionales bacterium CG10_big_fil_rev_8_21_14_0_10_45_34]|nr:MAG: replicative DNA helicase [Bdellovibrionales bacterium CG10_big_fil_rev_8_21_14_0_10_45_34]